MSAKNMKDELHLIADALECAAPSIDFQTTTTGTRKMKAWSERLRALATSMPEQLPAQGWMPIESAPHDDQTILLGGMYRGTWNRLLAAANRFRTVLAYGEFKPSHWLQIAAAPAPKEPSNE